MPFDPELLDALESSLVERIHGIVWRQVLHPTSVLRANFRGGRWNTSGIETLYCSLDPATASAEIDALLAAQPIIITRQRFTYPVEVELSRVADIRPTPFGGPFDFDFDINSADACRRIGAAASWLGLAGLLVPSVRSTGDNLIVFVTNQSPDDFLEPGEGMPYPPAPPADFQWQALSNGSQ